ncbi:hypothetical protein BO86DRAFT_329571 [Aspergillus japonicus CBS 114.51]|uniref:ER membrane protein complex subunit 2 n=2 Tax=Aspergillus TaxID=5052 RepID=A0A2V5GVS2_ASPV1|nr:hypothetical protein BO86DRAFT_329571 [Aspergillus japonicus CBS 114.51]PYI13192.1 hypothetical protein BO99DRAFT_397256 [Aspergillus violaceofuscus CBS 115571]RAH86536.1 hypothetical protein BO86DRAFT_329571 [Aspergillus japonicus CBS 114.51]
MAHNTPEMQYEHSSNLITISRLSQQAPRILEQHSPGGDSILAMPFLKRQHHESYDLLEQLAFACLQTGDDRSALWCIDRLASRFGSSNDKVIALRGLHEEATAEDRAALEECLHKYDAILSRDPVNLPILKRRVALLRSLHRPAEAITGLIRLLDAVPTDAEAWCELADMYHSQGMSSQAVFSLEEALLIVPNAWNVHCRLGEVLYSSASLADVGNARHLLRRSIQYFCRSIELCGDYLRGLYGLFIATSLLLEKKTDCQEESSVSANSISTDTLESLNTFARNRLEEIVGRRSSDCHLWEHGQAELIAVKELLDRFSRASD